MPGCCGYAAPLNLHSQYAQFFLFWWTYLPDSSQRLGPRLTETFADSNSILVVEHRFEAVILGDPLHARDNGFVTRDD